MGNYNSICLSVTTKPQCTQNNVDNNGLTEVQYICLKSKDFTVPIMWISDKKNILIHSTRLLML